MKKALSYAGTVAVGLLAILTMPIVLPVTILWILGDSTLKLIQTK